MKSALVGLALVLLFALGGWGFYRFLAHRGWTPLPDVQVSQLAGKWYSQGKELSLRIEGERLTLTGLDDSAVIFVSAGKGARWSESRPSSRVPRVLEWDGRALRLRIIEDSGRSEVLTLTR